MKFDNLLDFADWIGTRGAEALAEGVYRPSTETCRYCPLKTHGPGLCAARDRQMAELIGDPASLPTSMTPYLRGQLVNRASEIIEWLIGLKKQSLEAALSGNPDPGTKIVPGDRGDRKWGDEDEAAVELFTALGPRAFRQPPPVMLSPAQAEKELKPRRRFAGNPEAWERLQEIITRAPAGPVLVSSEDPRAEFRRMTDDVDDLDDLD